MLRKGRFAVVDKKEYKLFSCNQQYYLRTSNILELANGFAPWHGNQKEFIKRVCQEEIEDAYEVFPYVMLEGYRFSVEGADFHTGMVALVTSNPFVQKKIDVKPYGMDEYIIELPISNLMIEEERIAILGFENHHPSSFERIQNSRKNRL